MFEVLIYLVVGVALSSGVWILVVWNKFTRKVTRTKVVGDREVRRTISQIVVASLVAGFTIWLGGALASSSAPLVNWKEYGLPLLISLFACMGLLPLFVIIAFLMRVSSLRALYKYK